MTSLDLCFYKCHLVAVWENVVTIEVQDGRALGSDSENGDEGEIFERHSLRKLVELFRKFS